MLAEGVVAAPMDVDLCLVLGAGWPFHLGGITPYLDREGVSERVLGRRFLPPGVASVAEAPTVSLPSRALEPSSRLPLPEPVEGPSTGSGREVGALRRGSAVSGGQAARAASRSAAISAGVVPGS